jgi:hypothetical protein
MGNAAVIFSVEVDDAGEVAETFETTEETVDRST